MNVAATFAFIPQMVRTVCGILQMVRPIYGILQMVRPIYGILQMGRPIYGILQMGRPIYGIPVPVPIKASFLEGFCPFLSCFLLFHRQFVYEMPFLQKKSLHLTFSSRRSAIYKVPPRIGGHHFLLCQQTNTKDIAGQSATACHHRKFQFTYLLVSCPTR